ncbi:hypothetical protein NCAS_0D02840 [Naumovozyma castellii]|uniref:Uncharacterized protein n=1 Tax=Naumovozyma castellii TaxID=27288 RepID=G0VE74_NAUCA|nr:hypothetical protein NCAS_0D02840 [Naumovozyma castellii CBS 4309]CCC69865.1 hypothetical protein NCAS_0D02840 [Naumovozyma castellii CBS 4309]
MLVFKRSFFVSAKYFRALDKNLLLSYKKLFSDPCFNELRRRLPNNVEELEPYLLSKSLEPILETSSLPKEQHSVIHNKIIEELTKYDFGIATMHSKQLKKINQPLSINSFIEIIKNNPGRVSSSWELFCKYYAELPNIPDSILTTLLEKVITFDAADLEDEKKTMDVSDVAHSLIILDMIASKDSVKPELLEKLALAMLDKNISYTLPLVLKYVPITILMKKVGELTASQYYWVAKSYSFDEYKDDKQLLLRLLKSIGENTNIKLSADELEANKLLNDLLQSEGSLILKEPFAQNIEIRETILTTNLFNDLMDNIQKENLDTTEILFAKSILRILGMYRNDVPSFFDFHEIYLSKFPDHLEELMFETFKVLAFQSYRTSNESLLQYAEAFCENIKSPKMVITMLRVLILANAKFDVAKSLDLYNSKIQTLSREKDDVTGMAPSDLVTQSLILAYLSKQDIDFARVIFDGAVGERVITGLPSVTEIKKLMAKYGDAVENGDVKEIVDEEILALLKTI